MPLVHKSKRARAVIFDLDGTLVDSAPSMAQALSVMALRRGLGSVDVAAVRRWVSLGGEAMLRGTLGVIDDLASDLEELRGLLREQSPDSADLYPGVADTLATLKADGYRLGVCTNKRENIAVPYALGLGIADYLDVIIGGSENRRPKPHPDMALMTLGHLGVEASQAFFVGDSEVDAETAVAAKVPFILVTFGYPHGDINSIVADARVDTISDVPRAVAAMSGFSENSAKSAGIPLRGPHAATNPASGGVKRPDSPAE